MIKEFERDEVQYLSVNQFSNIVKVNPQTIRRSILAGKINAMRLGDGKKSHFRIPSSEIDRLLLMHKNGKYDFKH